ncbi:MAG: N(G),N(G)-dimethylarginine dimethylaminohydrolase [Planctomycetes bacterium]|nr:N(G),N(G)-dimethylarginine dimethylaminohydrolase [Planctomycetota bacterium]
MISQYAIVRNVAKTYDKCIKPAMSTAPIDVRLAQKQHQAYCKTLKALGLKMINIEADDRFPDCCFVEDPAIVIGDTTIISRMGVKSRIGEERAVEKTLSRHKKIYRIKPPGTIEGGDVLRIGHRIYIGLSERTNISAIKQVRTIAAKYGCEVIPVRVKGMIHLKTGCTYLGNNCITLVQGQLDAKPFAGYKKIIIPKSESYSANCLSVNGTILIPKGYTKTRQMIKNAGFKIKELDMSEFRAGGGSLTCLSVILSVINNS